MRVCVSRVKSMCYKFEYTKKNYANEVVQWHGRGCFDGWWWLNCWAVLAVHCWSHLEGHHCNSHAYCKNLRRSTEKSPLPNLTCTR